MQKLFFMLIFTSSNSPAYRINYAPVPLVFFYGFYGTDNDIGNDSIPYNGRNSEIVFRDNAVNTKTPEKVSTEIRPSPCSEFSASNGQQVTEFFNNKDYRAGFDELEKANVPGVGTEYAMLFGVDDQTGESAKLPRITTLSKNSVSIHVNPPGLIVTAIAHTHPDNLFPAPSAGDLYAFGNYAQSHPGFLYYILGADGSKYVLTVTNTGDLSRFLKSYPQEKYIEADSLGNPGRGANYKLGSELYLSMQQIATMILSKSATPDNPTLSELDIAHEAVQVYILDHYKTGMTLLKQDVNGNFNEIHAVIDSSNTRCGIIACN